MHKIKIAECVVKNNPLIFDVSYSLYASWEVIQSHNYYVGWHDCTSFMVGKFCANKVYNTESDHL